MHYGVDSWHQRLQEAIDRVIVEAHEEGPKTPVRYEIKRGATKRSFTGDSVPASTGGKVF